MRVYLSEEQYTSLTGKMAPPEWLRRASLQVENALAGVVYLTLPSGLPSDPVTLEAIQHAIIAQVAALDLLDTQEQTANSTFGGKLKNASIGGASYSIEPTPLPRDLDASTGKLVYQAWLELKAAGLTPQAWTYG